jgi:hypothetical protein
MQKEPQWKAIFKKFDLPMGKTLMASLQLLANSHDSLRLRYRNAIMNRMTPEVIAGEVSALFERYGLGDKNFDSFESLARSYCALEKRFTQLAQEHAILRRATDAVAAASDLNEFKDLVGLEKGEDG